MMCKGFLDDRLEQALLQSTLQYLLVQRPRTRPPLTELYAFTRCYLSGSEPHSQNNCQDRSSQTEHAPKMVASSLPRKASKQAVNVNSAASQIAKVAEYESQLASATKKTEFNPNALIPLTTLARNDSPEVAHKAVWALHRAWVKILSDGHLVPSSAGGHAESVKGKGSKEDDSPEAAAAVVQKWLMDRLKEYQDILVGFLHDSEPSLRVCSFTCLRH
jgi:hypothetical protein